jgi:hypothetical protein
MADVVHRHVIGQPDERIDSGPCRCDCRPGTRGRAGSRELGSRRAAQEGADRKARQQYRLLRQLIAAGNEDDVLT